MIKVFRYIRGYIEFTVSGSLPEKFLNVLSDNGVSVWNVRSREGIIYCKTLALNYKYIRKLLRNKNVRVRVVKKYGIPFFLLRNKKRIGLPIGMICFLLIFSVLSKFIWSINIYGNEDITYSRVKQVMETLGVYEGAYGKFDSLKNIQTKALIEFSNVSWITLNIDGSCAEVKITETAKENTREQDKYYNIVAKSDGQIIRADVKQGMAYVKNGDAAAKGSLLVGGFVQTDLGSTIPDSAEGVIIAETTHDEHISIPKKRTGLEYRDSHVTRRNANVLGLKLPLEIKCVENNSDKISFFKEYELDFKGKTAPVSCIKEHIFYIDTKQANIGEKSADNEFAAERLLTELFSYSDKKITDRNIAKSADDDYFYYDIEYLCEEDIGERVEIMLDEGFSYNGARSIEE